MNVRNLLRQWCSRVVSGEAECSTKRRGLRRKIGYGEGLETRTLLATFNVTNVNDAGPGSLRQAVTQANAANGADTILVSAPGEILLTSGQIQISDSVTITGTGIANSTINAQRKSQIFNITSAAGNVTLNRLTLLNGRTNSSAGGGAIYSASPGTLTISSSTLSGNSINGENAVGGAIFVNEGNLTINQSTLSGNSTSGSGSHGGAIFSRFSTVTLSQSTLWGNSTSGTEALGGAVCTFNGAVRISQSTFHGNTTSGIDSDGGAIFTRGCDVKLSQSTLSGNSTTGNEAAGGAVYSDGGEITLSHSTLTLNKASNDAGGGLASEYSPINIVNSIVAGNSDNGSAPDIRNSSFTAFVVKNSLVGRNNGTGMTATVANTPDVNGNFVGGNSAANMIDPKLVPLANNGGLTRTHALFPDSPALNRGRNSFAVDITQAGNPPLTYDQRGANFFRILAGNVDMGAFETRTLDGSAGADSFELIYSGTSSSGTVKVTAEFNGAPKTTLGTFPMNAPLTINGLGRTDSIRIVTTGGADTISVTSIGMTINGAMLYLANIEEGTLVGGAGSDTYKFDVDAKLGLWKLEEAAGGTDTIDFTSTTSSAVSLNLANPATQIVHPTNLSLTLDSATTIENIVGGSGADTLTGNSLGNSLKGGPGDDRLNGGGGSDLLFGGLNNDTYVFATATAAEADQVTENTNEGIDTLNFAALTTSVALHLGSNATQNVHTNRTLKLNSPNTFENSIGGSGADSLAGNGASNTLTGGPGEDKLSGGAGSDLLFGGLNNDTYLFTTASATEADQVTENTNEGTDTISFAALTTNVVMNLGLTTVQTIHTNRTLKLNSASTFENAIGGSGSDALLGNALANRLTGGNGDNILVGLDGSDILEAGSGRDILIGGLGLDTLNGGSNDDILIAGRTTSDSSLSNLNTLRTQWISGNTYATRIANLRAGVGSPAASLKAKTNVLNDAGEDDSLTGGTGTDWYFRAVDDVITDLINGEITDAL